jgi:hypothetical protein
MAMGYRFNALAEDGQNEFESPEKTGQADHRDFKLAIDYNHTVPRACRVEQIPEDAYGYSTAYDGNDDFSEEHGHSFASGANASAAEETRPS